ncbi:MAG: Rieske (2Fe-2S) protein [Alphaproteobacteria bacterium]|nr:Rieske (2Fe-2S) protein [Alphaproteobacteria bacterium]
MQSTPPSGRWYPIVRREELPPRHIFHALLCGKELALWREDSGRVNVWENRCPHRGLRLTIGGNLGSELRCRYHGWRFAGGSGQCVHIPAHPGETPPQAARVVRYPCREAYGFAWVALGGEASGGAPLPEIEAEASYAGRSLALPTSLQRVREALAEAGAAPTADPLVLTAVLDLSGPVKTSLLLLPASEEETWLHGLIHGTHLGAARSAVLQAYARWTKTLRRGLAADNDRGATGIEDGAC